VSVGQFRPEKDHLLQLEALALLLQELKPEEGEVRKLGVFAIAR
jgi:glycosyltransferase involved in cell wall biosynthesis